MWQQCDTRMSVPTAGSVSAALIIFYHDQSHPRGGLKKQKHHLPILITPRNPQSKDPVIWAAFQADAHAEFREIVPRKWVATIGTHVPSDCYSLKPRNAGASFFGGYLYFFRRVGFKRNDRKTTLFVFWRGGESHKKGHAHADLFEVPWPHSTRGRPAES